MIDLAPLPLDLVDHLRAPRQARPDRFQVLHAPSCPRLGQVETHGALVTASLLEVAASGSGGHCLCLGVRDGVLRGEMHMLMSINDPVGTRKPGRFMPGRIELGVYLELLESMVTDESELAPLVPAAHTDLRAARAAHEEWLTHSGVEALRRWVSALTLHPVEPTWSLTLEALVKHFCEGERAPIDLVHLPDVTVRADVVHDQLESFHAQRATPSDSVIALERTSMFPPMRITSRLGDVLKSLMPSPSSLVAPADLELLLPFVFGPTAGSYRIERFGPDTDPGVLEVLKRLLADGTDLTTAAAVARTL